MISSFNIQIISENACLGAPKRRSSLLQTRNCNIVARSLGDIIHHKHQTVWACSKQQYKRKSTRVGNVTISQGWKGAGDFSRLCRCVAKPNIDDHCQGWTLCFDSMIRLLFYQFICLLIWLFVLHLSEGALEGRYPFVCAFQRWMRASRLLTYPVPSLQ